MSWIWNKFQGELLKERQERILDFLCLSMNTRIFIENAHMFILVFSLSSVSASYSCVRNHLEIQWLKRTHILSQQESVSLLFPASRRGSRSVSPGSLPGSSLSLQPLSLHLLPLSLPPASFPRKDSCDHIGPTWITHANLPIRWSFTSSRLHSPFTL